MVAKVTAATPRNFTSSSVPGVGPSSHIRGSPAAHPHPITEVVEVLQFLRYTYQQDRLSLMQGLIASEQDLLNAETPSVSVDDVRDLLVKGQISKLVKLLNKGASELV